MSASLKRRTAIHSVFMAKIIHYDANLKRSDVGRININEKERFLHHVMLLVCIIIAYMYNAIPSGD